MTVDDLDEAGFMLTIETVSAKSARPTNRPRRVEPPLFPIPVKERGRWKFWRSEIEAHKRALAGLPELPIDPDKPDSLVDAKTVSEEFDFNRRTLGRRVKEAEDAAKEAPSAGADAA
jgi:hypothetical protein